jgi:hypothetical protein
MSRNFRNLFADDDDFDACNDGSQQSIASTILAKNSSTNQTNTNSTNRLFGEESTFLDNSTVPTYEEFLKKSGGSNGSQHFKSQSSNRFNYVAKAENKFTDTRVSVNNLVTDDESDDDKKDLENDSSDDEKTMRNQKTAKPLVPVLSSILNKIQQPLKVPVSPFQKQTIQTPASAKSTNNYFNSNKQPSTPISVATNRLPKTPASLLISKQLDRVNTTPRSASKNESCGEYIYFNNKVSQTSFNSSVCSSINNKSVVNDSLLAVDETTCLEKSDQRSSGNNQNSENATNNFQLHLSDTASTQQGDVVHSSSSSSSETETKSKSSKSVQKQLNYENKRDKNLNDFIQPPPPVKAMPQVKWSINPTRNVTERQKTAKKRISICGDGLTENVLNIDDTVIDQFDNELDYKSGKLCTLSDETMLGDEMRASNVLSSTKMSNDSSSLIVTRKSKTSEATGSRLAKPSRPQVNLKAIRESSSDDDQYEKCKNFQNNLKVKIVLFID